jgi:hypothetical protein
MAKNVKEHEFKGEAVFNHLDPHMARFVVEPIKGVRGVGPINLEPDIFPADFEIARYKVRAKVTVNVEIEYIPPPKPKK